MANDIKLNKKSTQGRLTGFEQQSQRTMSKLSTHGLLIIITLILSACGSGGDPNMPPTLTNPGSLSVIEGSTAVTTIEASDSESGSGGVTQTITGGADRASFAITSGGALTFSTAPDFEIPGDSDGDNTYNVTVQGADPQGATTTLTLSVTVTDAVEGRIIDGPLSGAQVFIDLDDDGTLDEDETSVTSDANGYFKAPPGVAAEGKTKKIVSIGGTDTATGKELPNIALISTLPTDPTKPVSVTPLTTVISSASTPEEQAEVLAALGITGTVDDLLTTDTWALAEAGDENAQALQRKNQQVGLILQTADSLVSDSAAASATALTAAVAAQIVEIAKASDTVDLTNTATITEVLSDTVASVDTGSTVDASAIAAVAGSVANVNTLVADPSIDPTGDAAKDIAEAAQTNLLSSVESLAAGTTDTAAFTSETDTATLLKDSTAAVAATDTDGDGITDLLDTDDDNDGVPDAKDAFSLNKDESVDTDGDNIGNNADPDEDGDSVADTVDAFPLISLGALTDTDKDGRPDDCDSACQTAGMTADTDDDGDGVADALDAFPLVSTETLDTDGDGIGNNTDTDDDGDGTLDVDDLFPLISNVQKKGAAGRAGYTVPEQVKVLETK